MTASAPRRTTKRVARRSARYPATLLSLFLLVAVALGVAPLHRGDWLLENALAVGAVAVLVLTWRRLPLSNASYTMLFVFLVLHEVGAHYTYSEVPYDDWFRAVLGTSPNDLFGVERNHYDRVVHFMYGLLVAYPMREVFVRVADARGFWGYMLPLDLVMSTSMAYELIEWGAAMAFGSELGQAYLGTQGDVWDAHKDMALASLGALCAMAVTLAINRGLGRDVAAEWAASFRVVHPEPLGEEAIARELALRGK